MFSTFSADLVEKIGRHKFQQPYLGNHILGCLQDGFQQALAAPFQNCVALVACHLACAPTTRRVSCAWGSCNTIRWAECSASGRTLGGRDTRQHLSWRFYSSAFSFRCFCREQARFAGDKAKCAFRYGKRCGNRCGSSGPDRVLGFLRFFLSKSLCLQFLSFFLIRVRKPAPLSGFLGRAYLASYLAFLQKSRHFCPKTGDFVSFHTYIVFRPPGSISATRIVQNQRTNQPALTLVAAITPFQGLTRNALGQETVAWVRLPPSAPKAAPCGVLLFIFAANYARDARWDSNSPCPALCVPPGCNSPADCCKGAGESHRLRQVSLLNSTLGSDFLLPVCKIPLLFYKHLPFIFK